MSRSLEHVQSFPFPMLTIDDHSYWSINSAEPSEISDPVANFTIKWIVGEPYNKSARNVSGFEADDYSSYFVWRDVPKMTALNCVPVFETVKAEVTVDVNSLAVQEYTLMTSPQNSSNAWSDFWIIHANSSDWNYPESSPEGTITPDYVNVTVS